MTTSEQIEISRFERVRQILRTAANEREAAYGGQRLWDYSHAELLAAEIHGVRLIAARAPAQSSCACCASEETGRGAASGLVQGFRGEAPFDGQRLPPLPWGGSPPPHAEIEFIRDWIDDGCPAESTFTASGVIPLTAEPARISHVVDLAAQIESFNAVNPNEYKYQRGELKQRMNIDCMSEAQIDRLRLAFRELYDLNKWPEDARSYNNLALIHQNHCQHGWERFLTWHRIYLYEFEQALQDICPDVTMPYWDWTMPQYKPAQPDKGWRIPRALQAFLTRESLEYLAKNHIPAAKLKDMVRTPEHPERLYATLTSFFADVEERIGSSYTTGEHRNRLIDALLDSNALWYPLRYPGEFHNSSGPSTINKEIHYHYPTADDIAQIMNLRTFRDFGGGSLYNDSFGFIDQNPHNTLHIWTGGENPLYNPKQPVAVEEQVPIPRGRNRAVRVAGRRFHKREDLYSQPQFGDMFSNLTASHDPVFWPIHANVDRLWWEWQQDHPHSLPADLDAVLTPWNYTARDTLDIYRFGYEYVRSACMIPVGTATPVGRFISPRIPVADTVRGNFREAEVRLHRVPQLLRSCFVRIFLNLPDANANTSISDPHYAGYLAIFGHGACYGGPGHCDVPPLQRRGYDLRPRDHNTPRNHRINVTKCAKQLFTQGADHLQITLVVIGVDYEEDNDLLRLEGVSLNFLD